MGARLLVVARQFPPLATARAIQAGRVVDALSKSGLDVRLVCEHKRQRQCNQTWVRTRKTLARLGEKVDRVRATIGLALGWDAMAWRGSEFLVRNQGLGH